jgi:hypothetical protein
VTEAADAFVDAARRALAAIAAGLGPRGQWPSWVAADPPTSEGRRDISPPVTALGMLALTGLAAAGLPEADSLLVRSRPHLELTVRPDGMWRYYADIPPDTDDSAMCALALGPEHPLRAATSAALAATVLPDGRFPTWYAPGWEPAVDAVANAHVVAVLGEGETTAAAVDWLGEVVATGRETASCAFYADPLDVHLAVRRAVDAGVGSLRPALTAAAERAQARLAAGGLSPYRAAQALLVADGTVDEPVARATRADLIADQEESGRWPRETMFVAGRTDAPGRWLYQSWAVVTALCARALVAARED